MPFDQRSLVHPEVGFSERDNIQTDIATYKLNPPNGKFSENRTDVNK